MLSCHAWTLNFHPKILCIPSNVYTSQDDYFAGRSVKYNTLIQREVFLNKLKLCSSKICSVQSFWKANLKCKRSGGLYRTAFFEWSVIKLRSRKCFVQFYSRLIDWILFEANVIMSEKVYKNYSIPLLLLIFKVLRETVCALLVGIGVRFETNLRSMRILSLF